MGFKDVHLSLATITNPSALLYCLLIYPSVYDRLCIHENLLNIEYVHRAGVDEYVGLTEPALLKLTESRNWKNRLALDVGNLHLALKIVTHALREGLILYRPYEKSELSLHDYVDSEEQLLFLCRQNPNLIRNEFGSICPQIGAEQATKMDFLCAIEDGADLALQSRLDWPISNDDTFFKANLSSPKELKQIIEKLSISRVEDYYHLIDNPKIFSTTIQATKAVINDQNFNENLLLYFPRLFLDIATGGLAHTLETTYLILKRKFTSKGDG